MAKKLLVVGAGMAAAYLLQELAHREHDLAITVVGDEPEACYNRVLLSNVLSGENAEADLVMLEENPPRLLNNTRVAGIDWERHVALTDSGEALEFDSLVLATGAAVAPPPVDCSGVGGVRQFRNLTDTRDLRALDATGQRAVVLGGGLLGLEAAHGLNALGFDTCVVHRNPVIMNRQLDAEGGRQLQRDLESRGMRFHLGASLEELEKAPGGEVRAVRLDDGSRLPCDLLLLATGILPSVQLARDCGLATGRGVLIDEYMRTSRESVYALGECSQLGATCFGLVAPIREQAAVLAARLAGGEHAPFRLRDYPTQLKISGVEIYRAGVLDDDAEQLTLRDAGVYRRLVVRDDRLVGAVLVGDKRGGTWYSDLILEGRDIGALRTGLIFGREVSEALGEAA